jgi:hypothetical protein
LQKWIWKAQIREHEETTRKLLKAVEEFSTYIRRNRDFIPNTGERYVMVRGISTGFAESAINQAVSKAAGGLRRTHIPCYSSNQSSKAAISRTPFVGGIRPSAATPKPRPHEGLPLEFIAPLYHLLQGIALLLMFVAGRKFLTNHACSQPAINSQSLGSRQYGEKT